MERIMVIVKPNRRSFRIVEKLNLFKESVLQKRGKKLEIIESSAKGGNSIFNLARQAKEEKYKNVFVVGGDGSVNLAASALAGSETVLSIIPTGSGNDISKGLLIPQSFMAALAVAFFGREIEIDLGLIDGNHIFVNVVSFGLDAKIVKNFSAFRKKYFFLPEKFLYLAALFNELLSVVEFPVIKALVKERSGVSVVESEKETLILVVANGPQYGGRFKIAPEASFIDREFNICWISKISKLRILSNFAKAIKGTHSDLADVVNLTGQTVFVSSSENLDCQFDGEIFESKKEYQISFSSEKLKVKAPPSFIAGF